MYLAVTVAFIWLASTAVSSGVSHWATLSHKLWQRRDEQRPQSYSCSLFLAFCGSLFSSPFPLNHFSLSIPPPFRTWTEFMQGKGLHPNSDSRTFWTPFWGIPFFSRPSPFLCNAFNKQVFRPYGGKADKEPYTITAAAKWIFVRWKVTKI